MGERAIWKRILVLVEDEYSQGFIEGLVERLQAKLEFKIVKLNGFNDAKIIRILKSFSHRYDLIAILKNQYELSEEEIHELIRRIINQIPSEIAGKLHWIVVKRTIDAWALADVDGLKSICPEISFTGDPEELTNPIEVLRSEFAKCGKVYVRSFEVGRKLGCAISLERAIQKSSSLKRFIDVLANS